MECVNSCHGLNSNLKYAHSFSPSSGVLIVPPPIDINASPPPAAGTFNSD
jgi:hypothetical protein